MKPGSWYQSANVAIEGILHAVRTQRHLRWHFMAAALVMLLGLYFGLDRVEFIGLALAISLVLITEILNTAVEAAVDLASEAFHPLAKVAKDTAAGAVFVAAFCAVVLGYFILYPHVARLFEKGVSQVRMAGETLAFISAVLVVIVVILAKARFGRGTPLVGGMPSGHAAVSFSIWVSLVYLTGNALIAALTLVLALMVSHSRVALGIHKTREVVLGAILGGLITLAVFLMFGG
jgi:diacylglycerol kinase (ATP)